MIFTTKAVCAKDGSYHINVYVGAETRVSLKVAHDYETYITDASSHERAAKLLFRKRMAARDLRDNRPTFTRGRGSELTVSSVSLPDACNHDYMVEVCEVSK